MAGLMLLKLLKIGLIITAALSFYFSNKKLNKQKIVGEVAGYIFIFIVYFVLKFYSQLNLPSIDDFCRITILGIVVKIYSWKQMDEY